MGRAWLTPNTPPDDKYYFRTLQIPAASDFLGLVTGALIELAQTHNWEKSGDMTEQETADYFLSMLQPFWHNNNEPPEWSDADELDGSPEQPWYDDLADWIIAGFLAVTFTPQAAITYQTTVPRLRVAIRTGNLGALFKVLINGVEVWTGDSYGPIIDVIDHVFDMSAETEPYTVRIEHNGVGENINGTRAKLEVIREGALADMVATILRADPNGCGIQWSTDNGGNWETIDLAQCIAEIATITANDAILQAIDNGIIPKPSGQPGASAPPAPGGCTTYHVKLDGNQQWHVPSPLGFDDTITVSNMVGGWCDGTLAWYCPDGSRYLAGACSEELKTHESGDVLNPGAYHMALVMLADATWYPAPLTTWTQQSGTTPIDIVFQANDGSLPDNTGSIEFDVTVCTAEAGTWTHTFDFSTGQLGWASDIRDGSGWGANYQSGEWRAPAAFCMYYTTPLNITQSTITRYQCTGTFHYGSVTLSIAPNYLSGPADATTEEGTGLTFELVDGDYLIMQRYDNAGVGIATIVFEGTGNNPFA